MRKLYIAKNLSLPANKILLVGDFINFCANSLPLSGSFKIYIVHDRDKHDITTTAAYHRGKNIIKIYGKKRALVDVLRSIAHELTHLMQDENDMLVGMIQDAGGDIENEANARAGELIKLYAKSSPERKRIYESINLSKIIS